MAGSRRAHRVRLGVVVWAQRSGREPTSAARAWRACARGFSCSSKFSWDGFLNRWHATIPVGAGVVEATGVCTVQLRAGLIYSNEVFFDRSELLRALRASRS